MASRPAVPHQDHKNAHIYTYIRSSSCASCILLITDVCKKPATSKTSRTQTAMQAAAVTNRESAGVTMPTLAASVRSRPKLMYIHMPSYISRQLWLLWF